MKGRNALYKGKPRPMNAQTKVIRLVLNANFLVAKSALMCEVLIFCKFRWMAAWAWDCGAGVEGPANCSHDWRSSSERVEVFPFRRATSCTILTASASLPLPIRLCRGGMRKHLSNIVHYGVTYKACVSTSLC